MKHALYHNHQTRLSGCCGSPNTAKSKARGVLSNGFEWGFTGVCANCGRQATFLSEFERGILCSRPENQPAVTPAWPWLVALLIFTLFALILVL